MFRSGSRAMLLAGGTDLVPNMKRRMQTPPVLVALRRVAGLRDVVSDGKNVSIGIARDAAGRWNRPRAEHEAAHADAAGVGGAASRGRVARRRQRREKCFDRDRARCCWPVEPTSCRT